MSFKDERGEVMGDIVSALEAADILGVTRQWVTELLRRGVIPATRVGQQWLILKSDVEAYKATQEEN